MFKPISFKSALSFSNRSFGHFDSKIKQQKELLSAVRKILPDALATHVQYCLLSGSKLLVYTDSAAWATQLRFYHQKLLSAVAHLAKDSAKNVQIKILIEQVGPSIHHAETAIIPADEKLASIRSLCFSAPENELTIALLKLVKTLESNRPAD
jgi:hypothetical protein